MIAEKFTEKVKNFFISHRVDRDIPDTVSHKLEKILNDNEADADLFYETLIQQLPKDAVKRLLIREWGGTGTLSLVKRMLEITRGAIDPTSYLVLLLDPAFATKIDQFADFFESLTDKLLTPVEMRRQFINSFQTSPKIVFRHLLLTDQDIDNVSKHGLVAGVTRKRTGLSSRFGGFAFANLIAKQLSGDTEDSPFQSVSSSPDIAFSATKERERLIDDVKARRSVIFKITVDGYHLFTFRDIVDFGKKYMNWDENFYEEGLIGQNSFFEVKTSQGLIKIPSYDAEAFLELSIPISAIEKLPDDLETNKVRFQYVSPD